MTRTTIIQQQAKRPAPPKRRFDPDTPAVHQTGAWQCSAASTAWLLRSLGFEHSQDDVVNWLMSMSPPGITEAKGLSSADGSGLVTVLRNLGLTATNAWLNFDQALAIAGSKPLVIGGVHFYHWVGVRARDGDILLLANPDQTNYDGIGSTMNRAEFARLGAFAGVWVEL